ncbi:long-chain fatty acid transport protein [Halopseudomonas xinjiangensis]|uniref:Long-chain fatty acid transport protein n=1 Tax=Halopseudomonas xinjiangensis TaxID=487184 RepID=A0A1H1R2Q4_9GAMM|nr:outer membrane protein transport protein [Halopseudomonas xinjiangensis]SDS29896.1 long-chain fatty acid transport protein [Halopseudomonas xinjiangensis]
MVRRTWFKTTLAAAVAVVSSPVMANGLAINEQSASSMGTGFAGRSSSVLDASTVFGNPAGMSQLDRTEISGGLALIDAKTDISDATGAFPGSNEGDMVPFTPVPFGYFVTPLNDRWHAGFGIYVPFGVISDYENAFQGRYYGEYSSVRVVTFQPTLSYKINDRVSVGFGPTINRIDGKLTRAVPFVPPATPVALPDGRVSILGDDIGYGFNAGVLVDVTEALSWGLTYRSKVDYTLEGRTKVSGFPVAALNGQYDAELDFTSPESVDTSLTYEVDDQWTLYGGLTWMRWSRLQEIVVENDAAPANLATVREEQNWSDTWSFALGASYQLNPSWVLRTGFAWDRSPTTDTDRTVRIPVGNRRVLSFGAGWRLSDDVTIDAAYAYLHEDTAEVNEPAYQAEYRNSAHGLSTQLTYRF